MSSNQEPEVVVVTGTAGGAGRAIARAFAGRGTHMGLLAGGPAPQSNWCHSKLPEASVFPFLLPASGPGVATHPSPALKLRQEPPA